LEGKPYATALLVRHPARMLYTRLVTYPSDQSFAAIPVERRNLIRQDLGIDLDAYEPIDQVFLHDTYTFAEQANWLSRGIPVIRIEAMQEIPYCQQTLKLLTGLDYDSRLVRNVLGRPVNQRSRAPKPISQIVAAFAPRQRDWYHAILGDVVGTFGYSLSD
jgi:hypothetical protein